MRPAPLCLLLIGLCCPAPVAAQQRDTLAFATGILTWLQLPSILRNREYCGEIGRAPDGRLIATGPIRGKAASCDPIAIRPPAIPLASYHTHAGHDPKTDEEIPSVLDVRGDMDRGVDGYVSTPGGRLWFIDGRTGALRQICGRGCLPTDPRAPRGGRDPLLRSYSFKDLRIRQGG